MSSMIALPGGGEGRWGVGWGGRGGWREVDWEGREREGVAIFVFLGWGWGGSGCRFLLLVPEFG